MLRFASFKNDAAELMSFTTLYVEIGTSLWSSVKSSPDNVLSAKAAATIADGKVNCPRTGRMHILTMEDQLLTTLMGICWMQTERDLAYQFCMSQAYNIDLVELSVPTARAYTNVAYM